jgi:RNase adapter protein RapZ
MAIKVVSFGYKHGKPPGGVRVFDIRTRFENPFRNPTLRDLDGTDPKVGAFITRDPRFEAQYRTLRSSVMLAPGAAWIGCTGGKHRSVYLAERLGQDLRIPVAHRDKEKGEPR